MSYDERTHPNTQSHAIQYIRLDSKLPLRQQMQTISRSRSDIFTRE